MEVSGRLPPGRAGPGPVTLPETGPGGQPGRAGGRPSPGHHQGSRRAALLAAPREGGETQGVRMRAGGACADVPAPGGAAGRRAGQRRGRGRPPEGVFYYYDLQGGRRGEEAEGGQRRRARLSRWVQLLYDHHNILI